MSNPILNMRSITKRFGDVLANDAISLELHAGEVLALLGENGAGKSTLMAILFGHYLADSGHIEVLGRPLPGGDTRAALDAGIGMVHQHFTLADNLSVLDNIMLGTEPLTRLRSRRREGAQKLMEVAQGCGLQIDVQARVGDLSVGQKQRVEILKALYRGAKILVLDEPTAVLTPQESDSLFSTLRQLVAQGMGVVFISHKLAEVMAVSTRVQVLRHGRVVAQARTQDTNKAELARWMVGDSSTQLNTASTFQEKSLGPTRLSLQNVCTRGARMTLRDVSLDLRCGEIVGIAGVSGNGQTLLADVLSGMLTPSAGQILLDGVALAKRPQNLVNQGVARVPEDRQNTGVLGDLPLWENICAESLHTPTFTKATLIQRTKARAYAQNILKAFDVRGASLDRPARKLSGGNIQKLILGRVLERADGQPVKLVVAHQPTWGLDVGAVQFVHQRLRAACAAGAAVLLISDDLDEIEMLADRIAVLHLGTLSPAQASQQWTREALGLAMAGSHAA